MLAAYLVCLIVGGVFVGLSVFSGLDKDADSGGFDKDLDGGDFDMDGAVDVDVDGDLDLSGDSELALHGDIDGVLAADFEADTALELDGSPSLSDTALAGRGDRAAAAAGEGPRRVKRRRRLWLPFLSFRFWTFGATFFGLTGTLLTTLGVAIEPTIALTAAAVGVGTGSLTAALVRALRKPVGADSIRSHEYAGRVAELLSPLSVGRVSKIAVTVRHRQRDMLAVFADGVESGPLPKGSRVVILGVDTQGRATVAPPTAMYDIQSTDADRLPVLEPLERDEEA